jgi:hypothetical protein
MRAVNLYTVLVWSSAWLNVWLNIRQSHFVLRLQMYKASVAGSLCGPDYTYPIWIVNLILCDLGGCNGIGGCVWSAAVMDCELYMGSHCVFWHICCILYIRALKDLKMVKIWPKYLVLVYKYSSNIENCCAFDVNIPNKYYTISTTVWVISNNFSFVFTINICLQYTCSVFFVFF